VRRLWLAGLIAILGLTVFLQHRGTDQSSNDFVFRLPPHPLPPLTIVAGDGRKIEALNDLRGKIVLLNIWATWCVPCRKEMPTLDRLQRQLGGHDFDVIALSVDKDGAQAVKRFYGQIGISHLPVRVAAISDEAQAALGVYGVPTTLLIDRQSWPAADLVDGQLS
jgi:thiol-disulfide isomerase/thioredoxin